MLDVRRDADADGRSVVLVSGQVDLATAPHLARSLRDAIGAGAKEITVDLTGVDFLDSTGIRALVQGARAAEQANATLYIRGARGWVARVLELTGVDQYLRPPGDQQHPRPPGDQQHPRPPGDQQPGAADAS